MKKKTLYKILAGAAALLLIALILSFAGSLLGNPITAFVATGKIRQHVAQKFPGQNLRVPFASYNFKFGSYQSQVSSETSIDTHFTVSYKGGEISDYYSDVLDRFTTYSRLESELNSATRHIIEQNFPHTTRLVGGHFTDKGLGNMKSLTLDMPFDLYNLPLPAEITLWVESPTQSFAAMARLLLELHQTMEDAGVSFAQYSISLEHPYIEDEHGNLRPEAYDSLAVSAFPATLISGNLDALESALQAFHEQQQAQYAELDREKEKELEQSAQP